MTAATPVANVFVQIANSGSIPAQIPSRGNHPVPRQGILNQTQPIETNKFYANFFLGSQTSPTWTHPYSVYWSKGGNLMSGGYSVVTWGLSVSHYDLSDYTFASSPSYTQNTFPDTNAKEYFGMTTLRVHSVHITLIGRI
jgi:endo-1,3(4)-beta-glucanase